MSKIKKFILNAKWYPSKLYNRIVFRVRHMEKGRKLITYGIIFVRGTGKISIGDNVRINSCREANPIGGDTKTILFAKGNGEIRIGNQCGISNTAICCLKKVELEGKVMIGAGCKIYDHDFHSINLDERMQSSDTGVKSAPILIKYGAFIGAHSIILKGVTIGKESVVGAGSVVTKDISDGELWAGNPAKFIRKL